jgi:hypothetical protein
VYVKGEDENPETTDVDRTGYDVDAVADDTANRPK